MRVFLSCPICQLVATATRAVSCVSFAVYTFLGAFALLAAARKTLSLATTLSKMWWAFTLLSCILAGVQLILVFTLKDGVSKYVCNDEHLVHEQDLCQSVAPTAAAITLGIYVVVLCIFGWVISQFKWEVGHDEALAAGGNSIDLSVKV